MGRRREKRARGEAAAAAPAAWRAGAPALWVAALAVILLASYASTFDAPFVRDAVGLIQGDPRITALTTSNLVRIVSGPYWWEASGGPLYRPAATLSFLVNHAVLGNGERPLGYHVVNVLLHALNAALLFRLARRLEASVETALLAAALFALHPIATEAVTNIAGRADLLAATGVLGALVIHVARPRVTGRRALGFAGLAILAFFAKENGLVLVPLALAYDAWLRPVSTDASPRWRLGFYAGLGALLAAWWAARRHALAGVTPDADFFGVNPLLGLSLVSSRLSALNVVARELWLLVWPARLSCDYSYDQLPLHPWTDAIEYGRAAAGAFSLVLLVVFGVLARRRAPAAAFSALLLAFALLPTSNLIVRIGSIMAERFLYLPLAGAAGLAACAVQAIAARAGRRSRGVWMMAGAIAAALAARTVVRNADWRDEETLLRAAARVCPRSYKVHKALAQTLLSAGVSGERVDEAVAEAQEAVRILDTRPLRPAEQSSETLLLLGLAYAGKGSALGEGAEAAAWYRRAIAVLERAAEVDRAVNAEAVARARAAGTPESDIRDRGQGRIYDVLGNLHLRLGDPEAALAPFAYLRHLEPTRNPGYALSALAEARRGRVEAAAVLALEAFVLNERPDTADMLREIYRAIDPGLAPFRPNGILDTDAPRVHADLGRACAALVRELAEAHAPEEKEVETRCADRYGVRP
jgi:tetratricopeptide (TPR) repeat protein